MRYSSRILAILALVFLIFTLLTACGGGSGDSQSQTGQSVDANASSAPAQTETVQASLPQADTSASADSLVASWKQVGSPDKFVNITKTDSGYQYEDNDGKYPATFKDGKLEVKATDTDMAEAYIDSATGHLVVVFQGGMTEYEKK